MLSLISDKDVPKLVQIMPDYVKEIYPDEETDELSIKAFLNAIISSPDRSMFIEYNDDNEIVGFLAFHIMLDTFRQDKKTLVGNSLYINPKYRDGKVFKRFLDLFDKTAEQLGASRVLLGFPKNGRFKRYRAVFERKGYRPFEEVLVKGIENEK